MVQRSFGVDTLGYLPQNDVIPEELSPDLVTLWIIDGVNSDCCRHRPIQMRNNYFSAPFSKVWIQPCIGNRLADGVAKIRRCCISDEPTSYATHRRTSLRCSVWQIRCQ